MASKKIFIENETSTDDEEPKALDPNDIVFDMKMDSICPLDNRYYPIVHNVSNFFSFKAWLFYRSKVELEYLKSLIKKLNKIPPYKITPKKQEKLFKIIDSYIEEYCENDNLINNILEHERKTLHDIKAVELSIAEFIKSKAPKEFHKFTNLIHFGLTSQDVNSVAMSIQIRTCIDGLFMQLIDKLITFIYILGVEWKNITILAHTHGQPAVPTKLGKEITIYCVRMSYWIQKFKDFTYYTKIGGAVGNLSAHKFAFPDIDWEDFFDTFARECGLIRWKLTTQITNYDDIVDIFSIILNLNNVLMDFSQDIWLYISKGYFSLKLPEDAVGSSTMPQKVNPINFENAEGNLRMANAGFETFINRLPISRLQRDLTDSTMLRNVGTYIGHCVLAYKNLIFGLDKLKVYIPAINNDIESHPECLSEAIQILLRRYNIDNGYELIRKATQNKYFKDLNEFKEAILTTLKENKIHTPEIEERINDLTYENY